jgi:hypothetical protein
MIYRKRAIAMAIVTLYYKRNKPNQAAFPGGSVSKFIARSTSSNSCAWHLISSCSLTAQKVATDILTAAL